MLTVETELNGDSGGTYERGPSFVGCYWPYRPGTRNFCPALASLVGPGQNIFFPHRILFQLIYTHWPASWAGSRAGSPVS